MSPNEACYRAYSAQLNQCDKELDDIHHGFAARHGLSDAALWILYALYDAGEAPLTQADLCIFWFLSRQTIHTALHTLRQQGIIELAPIPGNRKSKRIVLTADGRTLAQRVIFPLKQAEAQVFDAFSDEENRRFIEASRQRCALLRQFLEL